MSWSPQTGGPAVAIVGAGFAGLAMGVHLKQRGVDSFVIFEEATEPGGTWRDNVYPGAGCDIPSHLYSYSFAPYRDDQVRYPSQPEILNYLRECADRYGLQSHLRTGVQIVAAGYDEADSTWWLEAADGGRHQADVVVFAVGQLHVPNIPEITGRERFAGESTHSAQWRHDIDLAGRRVAVVGNGSSAAQIVPGIVDRVARLYSFQRSAAYVMPKPPVSFGGPLRAAFRALPGMHRFYRAVLFWRSEIVLFSALRRQPISRVLAAVTTRHLQSQVSDPALRAKLTPDYPIGCKRLLLSSDYYPALAREHVEVVREAIVEITPDGIRTADGRHRQIDVVLWATGFRTTEFLGTIDVTGRGGRKLAQQWEDGAYAYLGLAVDGFPNMFMMYGPNSNLGHNSVVLALEAQADYIAQVVQALRRRGRGAWEVRPERVSWWRELVDRALAGLVWTDACTSWFKDAEGRVTTNWPYRTPRYQRMLRRMSVEDFTFQPAGRPDDRC